MNLLKEPVKLSVQLARAMEVAILGKHRISIYANLKDYPTAKNDVRTALTSYSNINNDRAITVDNNAELMIEVVKPSFTQLFSQYETLKEIGDRITVARKNQKPSQDIPNNAKQLLKTAYERLNLGVNQIDHIVNVASTIAQMEGKDKIETVHIAEAIQYQAIDLEGLTILNK